MDLQESVGQSLAQIRSLQVACRARQASGKS